MLLPQSFWIVAALQTPPKKKPKNARASRGVKGPVKVGKAVVDQPRNRGKKLLNSTDFRENFLGFDANVGTLGCQRPLKLSADSPETETDNQSAETFGGRLTFFLGAG